MVNVVTWSLIVLVLNGAPALTTVPGFGSLDACREQVAMFERKPFGRWITVEAVCVPVKSDFPPEKRR